jgi:hypothetical protein
MDWLSINLNRMNILPLGLKTKLKKDYRVTEKELN